MAEIGGVLVGLIFVAAVIGLIIVNDLGTADSYQGISNSEIAQKSQNAEDEIVKVLSEMDTKLVTFFSELKEDLGFL